tara:strand:+ start:860 stop:1003 length:144 start_codon:yes stop_codon:yes gene_type:complete
MSGPYRNEDGEFLMTHTQMMQECAMDQRDSYDDREEDRPDHDEGDCE